MLRNRASIGIEFVKEESFQEDSSCKCSMLFAEREREREKEKERKKGGETKTEEAPLLRVLRVVRVDTNVFDEKIVECIFVCYYYIPRFLGGVMAFRVRRSLITFS